MKIRCFAFCAFYSQIVDEIYRKLKDILINGYVRHNRRSESYVKWKTYFTKFCNFPFQADNTVFDNFQFMEQQGYLSKFKLENLENIFFHIDKRAVDEIKLASKKIKYISLGQTEYDGKYHNVGETYF